MSLFGRLLHRYINLDSDKDEEENIVASITRNINFKGSNLWTLTFAIIIASVGLNVNSTAVVIGAMLISPLMGPIIGVGLGIGINDLDLVKRSAYNVLITVIISVVTSALYFAITPLHGANSELLARTTPTIWDVLIAFSGGMAGIVANTRKEKSTVIPGVAIATALMPPLCTAGFGIATGNLYFFLGAIYLFFINSVFICVATFLVIRFLKFHRREFKNPERKKRMTRYLLLVVFVTLTPSVWLAYRIVQKALFENNANNYIKHEIGFTNTQVVSKNLVYDRTHPKIELLMIGAILDSVQIDTLQNRLVKYGLDSTKLVIRQGMDARQEIDFAQVKASILDEVFKDQDSVARVINYNNSGASSASLREEIATLFPEITSFSIGKMVYVRTDSVVNRDTLYTLVANEQRRLNAEDHTRIQNWLQARLGVDTMAVIFQRQP